jgi:hypothetical protein
VQASAIMERINIDCTNLVELVMSLTDLGSGTTFCGRQEKATRRVTKLPAPGGMFRYELIERPCVTASETEISPL